MAPHALASAPMPGADRFVAREVRADSAARPEILSADLPASFAISPEERKQLAAALAFAHEQTLRSLGRGDAAKRITTTVEALASRVQADDRVGAARAIVAAMEAIGECRERVDADDMAALLNLDVVALVLDHANAAATGRDTLWRPALPAQPDPRIQSPRQESAAKDMRKLAD